MRLKEDAIAPVLQRVSAMGASRLMRATDAGLLRTIECLTIGAPGESGTTTGGNAPASIRTANQGRRNAADTINYLNVAKAALDKAAGQLERAGQIAPGDEPAQIAECEGVFQDILAAFGRILASTHFHGAPVFTAAHPDEGMALTYSVRILGQDFSFGFDITAFPGTFTGPERASATRAAVSQTLASMLRVRTVLAETIQELESRANLLAVEAWNLTAAHGQPRDLQFAEEVVNLTKFQVLNQSGTSPLDQSHPASKQILALLR